MLSILKKIHHPLPIEEAIEHVVQENVLPTMWNNIVKHETAALKINLQELDRKNLCDLAFVTIDGKDAKDFDDAVFCIKNNDGYDLYVAIADVSLYVKSGSEIDKEALNRGTSIYFPDLRLKV